MMTLAVCVRKQVFAIFTDRIYRRTIIARKMLVILCRVARTSSQFIGRKNKNKIASDDQHMQHTQRSAARQLSSSWIRIGRGLFKTFNNLIGTTNLEILCDLYWISSGQTLQYRKKHYSCMNWFSIVLSNTRMKHMNKHNAKKTPFDYLEN